MAGNLSMEQVKKALDSDKKIVLIDVRTAAEYRCGHISGSLNIPLDEIREIQDIVDDRHANIFLYCQTGKQSGCARSVLMYLGYTQVVNIGGVRDWPYGLVK